MSTPTTARPPKDVTDLKSKVGRDELTAIIRNHVEPLEHNADGSPDGQAPATDVVPPNIVQIHSAAAESPTTGPTPAEWFTHTFPTLSDRHGDAVLEVEDRDSMIVSDLCEDFLAATMGEEGNPEAPVVFLPSEERFYGYEIAQGIYRPASEDNLAARLSGLLLRCARETRGVDTRALKFKLRDSSQMRGVIQRARGVLPVDDDFFKNDLTEFIPCANGVLRLSDMELLPFSPNFRRRNKLAVPYRSDAQDCPLFLTTLLGSALKREDVDLLQRWCGMVLTGVNVSQTIMMLGGSAGTGKGAVIRVLVGIIGGSNVGTLRTRHLHERFEIGRFLGKTLLYGADVEENFLNSAGAPVLKSLTGGDPVTLELKGSNATPEVICRFNAVCTCNALPQIKLEGDVDAWRRRLAIIKFQGQRPANPIADLSEQILADEGPAVLNWMLEGLRKLRAEEWRLTRTAAQDKVVEDLLGESDSPSVFARERLVACPDAPLTTAACYASYVLYCDGRGWRSLSRKAFGNVIGEIIAHQFGLSPRHDVDGGDCTLQRGWKGVQVA